MHQIASACRILEDAMLKLLNTVKLDRARVGKGSRLIEEIQISESDADPITVVDANRPTTMESTGGAYSPTKEIGLQEGTISDIWGKRWRCRCTARRSNELGKTGVVENDRILASDLTDRRDHLARLPKRDVRALTCQNLAADSIELEVVQMLGPTIGHVHTMPATGSTGGHPFSRRAANQSLDRGLRLVGTTIGAVDIHDRKAVQAFLAKNSENHAVPPRMSFELAGTNAAETMTPSTVGYPGSIHPKRHNLGTEAVEFEDRTNVVPARKERKRHDLAAAVSRACCAQSCTERPDAAAV